MTFEEYAYGCDLLSLKQYKYMSPGDRQKPYYIIKYDEPDQPDLHFTDAEEAIKFYIKARMNWNCYLFELMKTEGL